MMHSKKKTSKKRKKSLGNISKEKSSIYRNIQQIKKIT